MPETAYVLEILIDRELKVDQHEHVNVYTDKI